MPELLIYLLALDGVLIFIFYLIWDRMKEEYKKNG
jgi:hypothetical protein